MPGIEQLLARAMALPTTYESVGPVAAARPNRSRMARVLSGAAVMLAITALVALAGQSTEQQRSSLIAVSPRSPINSIALEFLRNGAQMSVADIGKQMAALAKNPGAKLSFPARTMILAAAPKSEATQQLEGSLQLRLCTLLLLLLLGFCFAGPRYCC